MKDLVREAGVLGSISISGGNTAVSCSHYPVTLYLAVVFILEAS
jgi:hypothetical protein